MNALEKKQGSNDLEMLQLLGGGKLSAEQEAAAVEGASRRNPSAMLPLALFCLGQKARLASELEKATQALDELRGKLEASPWHPARFVEPVAATPVRALVAMGLKHFAVAVAPDANVMALRRGDSVYLNSTMNVLLGPAPKIIGPGSVGVFARRHNDRAVVRGPAGEEFVLDIGEDLKHGLEKGSLVLFDREALFALERVEAPPEGEDLLVDVPADLTIDRLGGLDDVFQEIVGEIALHLLHPHLVLAHALDAVKGILLTGPPGCGKTSIVRALAAYLRDQYRLDVRLLLSKPGSYRSQWFGGSEERIRQAFARATQLAEQGAFVLLFLDDMDAVGSREDSTVNPIDNRLIPVFLQEIEAVRNVERLMLVGASNRPDLLDEALTRSGRIDRVFRVPRPVRAAAREIFRRYLPPELPYRVGGAQGAEAAAILAESALAALYAENGELHTLGHLVLRDASRRPVVAPEVLSGALIRNAVTAAKRLSCFRAVRGQPVGLSAADMLEALEGELTTIARGMRPGPALRQMLQLPTDLDVVKVELPAAGQTPRRYRYTRLG
ncbi:MAG: AAA family ATPase [Candidatus Sulfopaludibacter sp.]|nr:AAA family ATPase [Candidatus Sulfopaludibacter sp.]